MSLTQLSRRVIPVGLPRRSTPTEERNLVVRRRSEQTSPPERCRIGSCRSAPVMVGSRDVRLADLETVAQELAATLGEVHAVTPLGGGGARYSLAPSRLAVIPSRIVCSLIYLSLMNCAEELAELLDSWRAVGTTPWNVRLNSSDGDELAAWRRQARAVELLAEVDQALEALHATDTKTKTRPFDRYVSQWYQAVFSYSLPWNTPTTAAAVGDDALNSLQSLAMLLDRGAQPPFSERRRSTLLSALEEAEALLRAEAEHLTEAELEYLWRLVNGARNYVAASRQRDERRLHEHVDHLAGALSGMAARLAADGEPRVASRFLGMSLRFGVALRTFAFDVAAGATGSIIATTAAPILGAITGAQ